MQPASLMLLVSGDCEGQGGITSEEEASRGAGEVGRSGLSDRYGGEGKVE